MKSYNALNAYTRKTFRKPKIKVIFYLDRGGELTLLERVKMCYNNNNNI